MRYLYQHRFVFLVAIFLFVLTSAHGAIAQESPSPPDKPGTSDPSASGAQGQNQAADEITAVPNRPTFSTTAEAVQRGVLEVEYGLEAADGHQNINGLIKFGIFKNLELRFANNPFERDAGIGGFGDSGAGFKYRIISEKGVLPTFSILYTASFSTSTGAPGIGAMGHGVDVLVSKDFGKHHFDFNEGVRLLGRPGTGGYDRNYFTAFDYSHPLPAKWGYAVEIAGFSRANGDACFHGDIAGGYIQREIAADSGRGRIYRSVRSFPRVTFFAGVTYSIADLYPYPPRNPDFERETIAEWKA